MGEFLSFVLTLFFLILKYWLRKCAFKNFLFLFLNVFYFLSHITILKTFFCKKKKTFFNKTAIKILIKKLTKNFEINFYDNDK